MKKLAALFLTLLFASTASAQVISNASENARMDGLGVSNWQIEDDFNIWINPAQLSNYKNAVYGELGEDPCTANCGDAVSGSGINGRNVGAYGGLHVDASYGGWGVYLGRPYESSLAGMIDPVTGSALTGLPSANRFDLFYATHGMPLGFYLSFASTSMETKTAATKTTVDASEINVGVGGLLMDKMLDVALNIGLPSYENKDTATAAKTEGDAGANFALLVRHHAAAGGGKLLSTLQFISGDMSTKATAAGSTAKLDNTLTAWSLDTALNSKPAEGTLLVAGIGINGTSSEIKATGGGKTTTDSMAIPVNVGVEHQTFKKVQTRVGLSKDIFNTSEIKVTGGAKTTTVADGAARVSAGLGWAVADNLMLDAVINQDVLFTGTYVVSGIPETLSSKLSATYRFK